MKAVDSEEEEEGISRLLTNNSMLVWSMSDLQNESGKVHAEAFIQILYNAFMKF
jgi:hypothetical protein